MLGNVFAGEHAQKVCDWVKILKEIHSEQQDGGNTYLRQVLTSFLKSVLGCSIQFIKLTNMESACGCKHGISFLMFSSHVS